MVNFHYIFIYLILCYTMISVLNILKLSLIIFISKIAAIYLQLTIFLTVKLITADVITKVLSSVLFFILFTLEYNSFYYNIENVSRYRVGKKFLSNTFLFFKNIFFKYTIF